MAQKEGAITSSDNRVVISRIVHRGMTRMLLSCSYDKNYIDLFKSVEGRRYSKTLQSWHLPYSKKALEEFLKLKLPYQIADACILDEIFEHLRAPAEKAIDAGDSVYNIEESKINEDVNGQSFITPKRIALLLNSLSEKNRQGLAHCINQLDQERYSWNTISQHVKVIDDFLNFSSNSSDHPLDERMKHFLTSKKYLSELEYKRSQRAITFYFNLNKHDS